MTEAAHPTSGAAPAPRVALQEDEVEEIARTLEKDATETQAGTTLEQKALLDPISRADRNNMFRDTVPDLARVQFRMKWCGLDLARGPAGSYRGSVEFHFLAHTFVTVSFL